MASCARAAKPDPATRITAQRRMRGGGRQEASSAHVERRRGLRHRGWKRTVEEALLAARVEAVQAHVALGHAVAAERFVAPWQAKRHSLQSLQPSALRWMRIGRQARGRPMSARRGRAHGRRNAHPRRCEQDRAQQRETTPTRPATDADPEGAHGGREGAMQQRQAGRATRRGWRRERPTRAAPPERRTSSRTTHDSGWPRRPCASSAGQPRHDLLQRARGHTQPQKTRPANAVSARTPSPRHVQRGTVQSASTVPTAVSGSSATSSDATSPRSREAARPANRRGTPPGTPPATRGVVPPLERNGCERDAAAAVTPPPGSPASRSIPAEPRSKMSRYDRSRAPTPAATRPRRRRRPGRWPPRAGYHLTDESERQSARR